ncbi:MAG: hypothetical protein Kow0074_21320 [Candidatus Zixiibacteriota bacterium]
MAAGGAVTKTSAAAAATVSAVNWAVKGDLLITMVYTHANWAAYMIRNQPASPNKNTQGAPVLLAVTSIPAT